MWASKNTSTPDLGGLVVDFVGGHYLLAAPLTLPTAGGGNIVFANGALHADPARFPPARFLLEAASIVDPPSAMFRYRDLHFRNMEFDAAQRAAGGLLVEQAMATRVEQCVFVGYTQIGLHSTGVGNELFASALWFREFPYHGDAEQTCHNASAKTGTAIVLDNNDHSLDNIVIACSKRGLQINGSAIVVRNLHVYVEGELPYPDGGVWILPGQQNIRFDSCYFDGCPLFFDNPENVQVANSFFLLIEGDQQEGGVVVLTAVGANVPVAGLQVAMNQLGGTPRTSPYPFVRLNETANNFFNHSAVLNTVIADNAFTGWMVKHGGLVPSSTRLSAEVLFPEQTADFVVDLSPRLVFARAANPLVTYSLQAAQAGDVFVPHALVNTSSSAVHIRTQRPIAGATLRLLVDQSDLYT